MNLIEIHEETSECTNRALIWGFTQAHGSIPEKCAMKIKEENKTTRRLIIILTIEGLYKALARKWLDGSQ